MSLSTFTTSSIVVIHVCLFTISNSNHFRVDGHLDHDHSDGHDDSDWKSKYTAGANQAVEGSLPFLDDGEKLNFMISPEDFFQQFVSKRNPVLIRNVVKSWPAYSLWSEEYLSEKYGDVALNVVDQEQNAATKMTMKEFLELYKKGSLTLSQEIISPLDADITMPTCLRCADLFQGPFRSRMQMSSGERVSSLHIEDREVLLCALRGNQSVTLVSPLQSANLYADEGNPMGTSPVDFTALDIEQFPRARSLHPISFDMQEGDMLYIPHLWWRQTALKEGVHQVVEISWTLKRDAVKAKDVGTDRSKGYGRLSFSNVLIQYEELLQEIGRSEERPQCRDQESFMSEYNFESSSEETHDGPDLTEDESCFFDEEHDMSPCQVEGFECDGKENELKCTKYVLDYCYNWEDRGCVVDLPQTLNRLPRQDLHQLQNLQYHFEFEP